MKKWAAAVSALLALGLAFLVGVSAYMRAARDEPDISVDYVLGSPEDMAGAEARLNATLAGQLEWRTSLDLQSGGADTESRWSLRVKPNGISTEPEPELTLDIELGQGYVFEPDADFAGTFAGEAAAELNLELVNAALETEPDENGEIHALLRLRDFTDRFPVSANFRNLELLNEGGGRSWIDASEVFNVPVPEDFSIDVEVRFNEMATEVIIGTGLRLRLESWSVPDGEGGVYFTALPTRDDAGEMSGEKLPGGSWGAYHLAARADGSVSLEDTELAFAFTPGTSSAMPYSLGGSPVLLTVEPDGVYFANLSGGEALARQCLLARGDYFERWEPDLYRVDFYDCGDFALLEFGDYIFLLERGDGLWQCTRRWDTWTEPHTPPGYEGQSAYLNPRALAWDGERLLSLTEVEYGEDLTRRAVLASLYGDGLEAAAWIYTPLNNGVRNMSLVTEAILE